MTPERWQQIKAWFDELADLTPAARQPLVEQLTRTDASLCRAVQSLLAVADEPESGLRAPIRQAQAELAAEAAAELVGQAIGPYRVLRELGRGGMGAVYLAARDDGEFKQQVALKVIKRGMDTEAVRRRFLTERQILADLKHPHIAQLLDGGTTRDGLPYFVMEYVEGEPIDRYCDARQLGLNERLRLFLQVCATVQYAHGKLVVHRDLKPDNILVTTPDDTETGAPKLLDFGIAKLLTPDTNGANSVLQGERPMTPAYASPEQARGEHIGTASDVYALGVVLYELLTGQRPYQLTDLSEAEIKRVICEHEPARPSAVASDGKRRRELAGDLDNIVLKALRKEASERYSSVEQLAADISRYLAEQPVMARPATMRYRAGKFMRRHRAAQSHAAGIKSPAGQLRRVLLRAARIYFGAKRREHGRSSQQMPLRYGIAHRGRSIRRKRRCSSSRTIARRSSSTRNTSPWPASRSCRRGRLPMPAGW